MRNRIFCGCVFLVLQALAFGQGPSVVIAPAVEVSFEARTNQFYRLETASELAPDKWMPLSLTIRGKGVPITHCIRPTAIVQFFRARQFDLTNGLFALYPFDGGAFQEIPKPFGVGSGNGSAFSFTSSRFGTPHHAATYALGESIDHPVSVGVRDFPPSTNNFTVSLWISSLFWSRQLEASAPFGDIFTTHRHILDLVATNSSGAIELYAGGLSSAVLTTQPLSWERSRWYHIAVVRENKRFSIYRDLELVGEANSNAVIAATGFDLGSIGSNIDETRFYTRALSVEELAALNQLPEH